MCKHSPLNPEDEWGIGMGRLHKEDELSLWVGNKI